jgi:hypothetical protein
MTFTAFEHAVLCWFIDHATSKAVAEQLRASVPVSRNYTGVGLYLDLAISSTEVERVPTDTPRPINGPEIAAPSLKAGAGCILWHDEGLVTCLEVYTYDDPMSGDLVAYTLRSVQARKCDPQE